MLKQKLGAKTMKINLHLEVLKIFQLDFGLDSEKQIGDTKALPAPAEDATLVEVHPDPAPAKKE